MSKYRVTGEAIIRKTYEVEAEDEQGAMELANQDFTVQHEDGEHYSQQAIDCEEV